MHSVAPVADAVYASRWAASTMPRCRWGGCRRLCTEARARGSARRGRRRARARPSCSGRARRRRTRRPRRRRAPTRGATPASARDVFVAAGKPHPVRGECGEALGHALCASGTDRRERRRRSQRDAGHDHASPPSFGGVACSPRNRAPRASAKTGVTYVTSAERDAPARRPSSRRARGRAQCRRPRARPPP